jgi:hypothetical protein
LKISNKKSIFNTVRNITAYNIIKSKGSFFTSAILYLFNPLPFAIFWVLVFSVYFKVDIFTHFAISEKNEVISKSQPYSKDIAIIEFDQDSMQNLGNNADSRHNIFKLVDHILDLSKPKLIILDYKLTQNHSEKIVYKKKYINKVIWGSVPIYYGNKYSEPGYSSGSFDFNSEDLKTELEINKPWGHLLLTASPDINNSVSSTQLAKRPKKGTLYTDIDISPSLSFLAYSIGEKSKNGDELRKKLFNIDQTCTHEIFNFLNNCNDLFRNMRFNVPPLPSYFLSYPSYMVKQSPNELIPNLDELNGKYIFISSTWNKKADHFKSTISSELSILTNTFEMSELFAINSGQHLIPGVYFHASILENILNKNFTFPIKTNNIKYMVILILSIIFTLIFTILTNKVIVYSQLKLKTDSLFLFSSIYFVVTLFIASKFLVEFLILNLNLVINFVPIYFVCSLIGILGLIFFQTDTEEEQKQP